MEEVNSHGKQDKDIKAIIILERKKVSEPITIIKQNTTKVCGKMVDNMVMELCMIRELNYIQEGGLMGTLQVFMIISIEYFIYDPIDQYYS